MMRLLALLGLAAAQTCGDVKALYKDEQCCGSDQAQPLTSVCATPSGLTTDTKLRFIADEVPCRIPRMT